MNGVVHILLTILFLHFIMVPANITKIFPPQIFMLINSSRFNCHVFLLCGIALLGEGLATPDYGSSPGLPLYLTPDKSQ